MSLGRIHLRDFVIVKELEIEFSKGFTVLTTHAIPTDTWHHVVVSSDGSRKATGVKM